MLTTHRNPFDSLLSAWVRNSSAQSGSKRQEFQRAYKIRLSGLWLLPKHQAQRKQMDTRHTQYPKHCSIGQGEILYTYIWATNWYSAYLSGTHQPRRKQSGSKISRSQSPPYQQKWPVHQKLRAAIQAAHPSYDGIRMPGLEVRCPQPCPEAVSVTFQVSSHCRSLLRW